jgi:hypothetical protein
MTSATDPEWDAIIRTWGHAYILSHDPQAPPGHEYAAQPTSPGGTLYAPTKAGLLDAIKDHAAARLSAPGTP